jgi:isoleucyl-tRNA synthetase
MSNFYLDIIKDRLYCDETESVSRRAAQTAIYVILNALVRMLTPILAFTSEELWAAMPHGAGDDIDSVLYNPMPQSVSTYKLSPGGEARWDKLLRLRTDVNKALELARAEKIIGKPLDAEITLYVPDSAAFLQDIDGEDLKTLFIVSKVNITEGGGSGYEGTEFPGVTVSVAQSGDPKCPRCWVHDSDAGKDHPELCPRCARAVG